MTFEQYWKAIQKQNPTTDGEHVRMTSEQFEKMQRQAFDKGEDHGFKRGVKFSQTVQPKADSNPFGNVKFPWQ